MAKSVTSGRYLVMDSDSNVIAEGTVHSGYDSENIQIKITGGSAEEVEKTETVQLMAADSDTMELAQVIYRRDNTVVMEIIEKLGREVRRNLRVPVSVESYIYPLTGGRAAIELADLSCGGTAFYCDKLLMEHTRYEIVIPMVRGEPLLLRCEILRARSDGDRNLYAAKFTDLIHDEESLLRSNVFNIQLRSVRLART